MMINSVEKFIWNLRWVALFFLKPQTSQKKENYGFKSQKTPTAMDELKPFEDDLIDMIKNIEFKKVDNPFRKKLKNEQDFIKNETKIFVAADKTTNFYLIEPKEYQEIVDKNVQKEYKKEKKQTVTKINKAHKKIVRKIDLLDRMYQTTDRNAFVTAKDHKENFKNSPTFRLINPTKPELGKGCSSRRQFGGF